MLILVLIRLMADVPEHGVCLRMAGRRVVRLVLEVFPLGIIVVGIKTSTVLFLVVRQQF
jgi:hypothetical protein